MCRGIDAARQSADDDHAGFGEAGAELVGDFEAIGRRGARADHGDGGQRQQWRGAAHPEQRRRIGNPGEQRRIVARAPRQRLDAVAGGVGQRAIRRGSRGI